MNNLKLAVKIGLGFGVLIVFTIIVSLFSWRGLSTLNGGAMEYQRIAVNSNLIGSIQTAMLNMQMSVKDFINSGSEQAVTAYQGSYADMNRYMASVQATVTDPEKINYLQRIESNISSYNTAFEQMVAMKAARDTTLQQLDTLGPEMEAVLSEIMANAARTGATSSGYKSGLSLRLLLLTRLDVDSFLKDNTEANATRVTERMTEFQTGLKELRGSLLYAEWQTMVDEIEVKIAEFQKAFGQMVAVTTSRNALMRDTIEALGPVIAAATQEIEKSYVEDQNSLGAELSSTSSTATVTVLVASLVAVILAPW